MVLFIWVLVIFSCYLNVTIVLAHFISYYRIGSFFGTYVYLRNVCESLAIMISAYVRTTKRKRNEKGTWILVI